jgi:hypothetical protein
MSAYEGDNDDNTLVDRTPDGCMRDAANPGGEVVREYGIVDLNTSFHSRQDVYDPGPTQPDVKQVVVPFRVAARGFSSRRAAERAAEVREDEEGGDFKVVKLSDTRGL